MTNQNLNQAREWAEAYKGFDHLTNRVKAAVEVIQSLPDKWLDAEKVQDLVDKADKGIYSGGYFIQKMKALITTKLPTLADMTQDEREACKWAQADMEQHGRAIITCILDDSVQFMKGNGLLVTVWEKDYGKVTPLPDLPKLKWPAQEPSPDRVSMSEMWVDDGSSPLDALKLLADKYEELDRLNPEEVPPNEPWLIEVDNVKAIGTRYKGYAVTPWAVAALNGLFARNYEDSEVTLIHKIVPEPPALPEGMRLADHKEYGRVVVSPSADPIAGYRVFFSISAAIAGANWKYADESELTFLDDERQGE